MTIGGMELMLHYHLKKRPPVFDPPYSSFLRSCPDSENEKIDIDIFYEDPPSLQKKPVFTMEQAWSIHLNDHFYFIDVVLPPQIPGQWRARFQPDSANISNRLCSNVGSFFSIASIEGNPGLDCPSTI